MEQKTIKNVSDSVVEQVFQIRPEHLNAAERLFGGRLMEWIDEVAALVGILEVRVDTYVESLDGVRKPINRAYLILVALDREGAPTQVPGLNITSESEKAEWEAGIKRRKMHRSGILELSCLNFITTELICHSRACHKEDKNEYITI